MSKLSPGGVVDELKESQGWNDTSLVELFTEWLEYSADRSAQENFIAFLKASASSD